MEEQANSQLHLIYSDEAISFLEHPVSNFSLTRKLVISIWPRSKLHSSEQTKAVNSTCKVLTQ
jgi:hypothetical protein